VPRFGQEGSRQCQEKDDDDERERKKGAPLRLRGVECFLNV
jgi:hypothetical protein